MLLEQVGWGVRLKVIKLFLVFPPSSNLNVSRIMVKRTNLPRRGTTREVGGMISARRRKNTVRESRMEMHKVTWWHSGDCDIANDNGDGNGDNADENDHKGDNG